MSTWQTAFLMIGLAALLSTATATGPVEGCQRRPGMICCGSKPFEQDPDKKCCKYGNDMIYISKGKCDDQGYANETQEWCRELKYTPLFQGCCYNQTYELATQHCCRGNSKDKRTVVSRGSTCCDGRALAPDHLCCHVDDQERQVLRQHPSHNACCPGSDPRAGHNISTYSSAESYCSRGGRVKTKPDLGKFAETVSWGATKSSPRNGSLPPITNAFPPSPQTSTTTASGRVRRPQTTGPASTAPSQTGKPPTALLPGGSHPAAWPRSPCGRLRVGESCCGQTTLPIHRETISCCQGKWPYDPRLLTCDPVYHGLALAPGAARGEDLATQLCTRSLPELGKHWRAPELLDMVRIQGRVERCGVRITPGYLVIPLTPAVVRRDGFRAPDCLGRHRLVLQIATPSHSHECRGSPRKRLKALKKYLTDSTLDIYVQPRRMSCHGKILTLRLADTALVFRSRLMDAHLIQDAIGE